MDVLTSAASAHEAASEAQSSGEPSGSNCEAQVLALKRKLIECDQQSRDQRERISGLEKGLDIEKREHQLTTSKLTMLLKKRGSSCTQYAAAARTPAAVLASTPCVPRTDASAKRACQGSLVAHALISTHPRLAGAIRGGAAHQPQTWRDSRAVPLGWRPSVRQRTLRPQTAPHRTRSHACAFGRRPAWRTAWRSEERARLPGQKRRPGRRRRPGAAPR